MKNGIHIFIYTVLVVAFIAYKWVENSNVLPPFFPHYFEDLLAMPIFLKTALLIIQSLHIKWRSYTILKRDVLIITALTGVYFEWILPSFDHRFTNDPLDFVAYAIGSGLYILVMNKPLKLQVKLG